MDRAADSTYKTEALTKSRLSNHEWHGRLMFGSDLPVWQAHENVGLTMMYRKYVEAFRATGIDGVCAGRSFLG